MQHIKEDYQTLVNLINITLKIITSQLYQEKTLKRLRRLDSGEHKIETPLLTRIEREKNYQGNMLFQVCWNVDFVVKYFQEEPGTPVPFTKKLTGNV